MPDAYSDNFQIRPRRLPVLRSDCPINDEREH
jgi:hypothetical protein